MIIVKNKDLTLTLSGYKRNKSYTIRLMLTQFGGVEKFKNELQTALLTHKDYKVADIHRNYRIADTRKD